MISFLRFLFISIEQINQTLNTMFDHINKHLEVRQKYSTTTYFPLSSRCLDMCGQTRSPVFDILSIYG